MTRRAAHRTRASGRPSGMSKCGRRSREPDPVELPRYPYNQTLEQRSDQPQRRPVVIVGADPVGLTLALDLAKRDVPVVVIDDSDRIGEGSRAVCWAKKTLEVFDRIGVGEAVAREGVRWQRGRVFH